MKKRVLILCTGNSARSQMAEGLLLHIGKGGYNVESAGTKPSLIRPEAIIVLKEIGIDISTNHSKSVEKFVGREFDFVITVCENARESCPYFPAQTKLIHHNFADPAAVEGDEGTRLQAFRKVRDEIHRFLLEFIGKY